MTKVINPFLKEEDKKLKPIQFIQFLCSQTLTFTDCHYNPKSFDFVELQSVSKYGVFDLIKAWDKHNVNNPVFYLGHWNDGVV